jgi:hypothetical protein
MIIINLKKIIDVLFFIQFNFFFIEKKKIVLPLDVLFYY